MNNTLAKLSLLSIVFLTISACSSAGKSCSADNNYCTKPQFAQVIQDVNPSGVITLARQLPAKTSADLTKALGFIPFDSNKPWVKVNLKTMTLEFRSGNSLISTAALPYQSNLEAGTYTVQIKQENPVWYADDNYFISRELNIPAKFSQKRFLQGVLGDYALFLNENSLVHNSDFELNKNDLRLPHSTIKQLYNFVTPDSLILVE